MHCLLFRDMIKHIIIYYSINQHKLLYHFKTILKVEIERKTTINIHKHKPNLTLVGLGWLVILIHNPMCNKPQTTWDEFLTGMTILIQLVRVWYNLTSSCFYLFSNPTLWSNGRQIHKLEYKLCIKDLLYPNINVLMMIVLVQNWILEKRS